MCNAERTRTTKEPAAKADEATQPVVGLTVAQVSERLQLHPMTTLRLLQRGAIAGVKVGRMWRVHPDAIDDFLKRPADLPAASAPVPESADKPNRQFSKEEYAEAILKKYAAAAKAKPPIKAVRNVKSRK